MFSRFTWIFLIHCKQQAVECFLQFQKIVKMQINRDIKQVQSDWGGDYRSLSSLLAKQRIVHRITCPHTLEQNGVAERKHRHIVEVGLTLLAQAKFSLQVWGYMFACAVHLINHLPTLVLQSQSPFSVLYYKDPDYSYLRVFGCCCYPYLRSFNSNKMELRPESCTFLGYSSQHKGYQCLLDSGKIIIS